MQTMKNVQLISIVIPAYNEEKYITKCLAALKAQHTSIPYEIIVVDNASTDATAAIAKKRGASVIYESKKGVARAVNTGLRKAKGSYIALIDADTIVPTMWLQRIYEMFQKHPNAVCIGGPGNFYNGPFFIVRTFEILNRLALGLRIVQPMGFNMAISKKARTLALNSGNYQDLQWDRCMVNSLKPYGQIIFSPLLTVSMSSRRWRSPGIILTETIQRLINVVSLAVVKKPIFLSFKDYR